MRESFFVHLIVLPKKWWKVLTLTLLFHGGLFDDARKQWMMMMKEGWPNVGWFEAKYLTLFYRPNAKISQGKFMSRRFFRENVTNCKRADVCCFMCHQPSTEDEMEEPAPKITGNHIQSQVHPESGIVLTGTSRQGLAELLWYICISKSSSSLSRLFSGPWNVWLLPFRIFNLCPYTLCLKHPWRTLFITMKFLTKTCSTSWCTEIYQVF